MSRKPSPHLSWAELACKDGHAYPHEWRSNRAIQLAEIFEIIRAECGGKPIKVLSAYRSPEHNRKIGGARHSQHMQGRALDLRPPKGMTAKKMYNIIKELSKTFKSIGGIGRYRNFVHVDIRPRKADRVAMWRSDALKDDRA